jgi:hypothetical protein
MDNEQKSSIIPNFINKLFDFENEQRLPPVEKNVKALEQFKKLVN